MNGAARRVAGTGGHDSSVGSGRPTRLKSAVSYGGRKQRTITVQDCRVGLSLERERSVYEQCCVTRAVYMARLPRRRREEEDHVSYTYSLKSLSVDFLLFPKMSSSVLDYNTIEMKLLFIIYSFILVFHKFHNSSRVRNRDNRVLFLSHQTLLFYLLKNTHNLLNAYKT